MHYKWLGLPMEQLSYVVYPSVLPHYRVTNAVKLADMVTSIAFLLLLLFFEWIMSLKEKKERKKRRVGWVRWDIHVPCLVYFETTEVHSVHALFSRWCPFPLDSQNQCYVSRMSRKGEGPRAEKQLAPPLLETTPTPTPTPSLMQKQNTKTSNMHIKSAIEYCCWIS